MPVSEQIRSEQRAREIFESAVAGIIVNCGVSARGAAAILLREAEQVLKPAGAKAALKK